MNLGGRYEQRIVEARSYHRAAAVLGAGLTGFAMDGDWKKGTDRAKPPRQPPGLSTRYDEKLHRRDRIGRYTIKLGRTKTPYPASLGPDVGMASPGLGRVGSMRPRDVVKLLLGNGWSYKRQKGSHAIYEHPDFPRTVTVPMHARTMPRGTMMFVLKTAGMLA